MAFIHNVEISWNDLMDAFASATSDRIYFLDRFTGEVICVPAAMDDEELWRQIEHNHERFLEIPRLDFSSEKKIFASFITTIEDPELRTLLDLVKAGKKPYGTVSDVLSFFPDEQEKMFEIKDDFVTVKVKNWLEEHNLFTMGNDALMSSIPF